MSWAGSPYSPKSSHGIYAFNVMSAFDTFLFWKRFGQKKLFSGHVFLLVSNKLEVIFQGMVSVPNCLQYKCFKSVFIASILILGFTSKILVQKSNKFYLCTSGGCKIFHSSCEVPTFFLMYICFHVELCFYHLIFWKSKYHRIVCFPSLDEYT